MAVDIPPEEAKEGAPEWMVTFADMMSLLLTFFVLLLSFSSIEIVKFKAMSGSMKDAFGLPPFNTAYRASRRYRRRMRR